MGDDERNLQGSNFVLCPGDPSQAEGETIQMHLGISLSALQNLIHLKRIGKDPTIAGGGIRY